VINQKVDRVKRLLREGELTVSEIAYRLGYSNVQHLSNQFKKVTGLSVSEFKATYGALSESYARSSAISLNRAIAA
jgi:AraC-like DNA-binding protein